MPKISYQEIVTADVSESGTVKHEWILEGEGNFVRLLHYIDSAFVHTLRYGDAIKKWNELCRSKELQITEKDLQESQKKLNLKKLKR